MTPPGSMHVRARLAGRARRSVCSWCWRGQGRNRRWQCVCQVDPYRGTPTRRPDVDPASRRHTLWLPVTALWLRYSQSWIYRPISCRCVYMYSILIECLCVCTVYLMHVYMYSVPCISACTCTVHLIQVQYTRYKHVYMIVYRMYYVLNAEACTCIACITCAPYAETLSLEKCEKHTRNTRNIRQTQETYEKHEKQSQVTVCTRSNV